MGAIAHHLKTKVFITGNPQSQESDIIQLIAPLFKIKTVTYQYSFLGFTSTIMLSTADRFIIFSDIFKNIFNNDILGPKSFESQGYIYDYPHKLIELKAKRHRSFLEKNGVKYVICLFDESVKYIYLLNMLYLIQVLD